MVKIDWNAFIQKNPAAQTAFEQLCYAIVCRIYNQGSGVLRYFNQKYIETDPIVCGKEIIGFQAKFWPNVVLSSRKGEIEKAIREAIECYKNLTHFIFFCPVDLASDKCDGPCKCSWWNKIVEDYWKKYNVRVEFFGLSRFEGTFNQSSNDDLGRFYFSLNQNEYDVFKALISATQVWTTNTADVLKFNGKEIRIPRENEMKVLDDVERDAVVIVRGPSGCGKSGMIKHWVMSHCPENRFVVSIKSDELLDELSSVRLASRNTTTHKIIDEIKTATAPLFVFDSVERVFERNEEDRLGVLVSGLAAAGVQLIFTVREEFSQDLKTLIKRVLDKPCYDLQMTILAENELHDFAIQNGFEIPSVSRIWNLLQNLFYLQLFLDRGGRATAMNVRAFKRELWRLNVQDSGRAQTLGRVLIDIVRRKIEEGTVRLQPRHDENNAIEDLCRLQILIPASEGSISFVVKHDAYEDWALEHYIEDTCIENGFYKTVSELSQCYPMRRAFRNWLSDACSEDEDVLNEAVEYVLDNGASDTSDEILQALIISGRIDSYFVAIESSGRPLKDALVRMVQLAITRCTVDHALLLSELERSCMPERFQIEAYGDGWDVLIEKILALLEENVEDREVGIFLRALRIWTHNRPNGQLLGKVGRCALALIEEFQTGKLLFHNHYYEDLADVIVCSSEMIRAELSKLIVTHLKRLRRNVDDLVSTDEFLIRFCDKIILDTAHYAKLVVACPELTCQIFYTYCFVPKLAHSESESSHSDSLTYMSKIGIRDQYQKTFCHSSAYEGPFYWIISGFLRAKDDRWLRGYRLLLMTINGLTTRMYKLFPNCFTVKTVTVGQQDIRVLYSNALWSYRHKVKELDLPPIYRSLVCTLEKCTYETVQKCEGEARCEVDAFLADLGRRTNSASVLSALLTTSLFDHKCNFNLVSELAKDSEFIRADWMRRELDKSLIYRPCVYAITSIYQFERTRFARESARRWAIGDILRMIQLDGESGDEELVARAQEIKKILDCHFEHIEEYSPEQQHVVYCADVRYAEKQIVHTANGDQTVLAGVKLPPHLQDRVDAASKEMSIFNAVSSIMNYLDAESLGDITSPYYGLYNDKSISLIQQFKLIDESSGVLNDSIKDDCLFSISPIVYLEGHQTLSDSVKQRCLLLFDRGIKSFKEGNHHPHSFRCVSFIPGICYVGDEALRNKYVKELSSLLSNHEQRTFGRVCDVAAETVRKMYEISPELWKRIFDLYQTNDKKGDDFDRAYLSLIMLPEGLNNDDKMRHVWASVKIVVPVYMNVHAEDCTRLCGTVGSHCYFNHLFRLSFASSSRDLLNILDYLWSHMKDGSLNFLLGYLRDALTRKEHIAQFWVAWQHCFILFEQFIEPYEDIPQSSEHVLRRLVFGDVRISPEPVLQSSWQTKGKNYFKQVFSSKIVLSKPTGLLVLTAALGQMNIPFFEDGVLALLKGYKTVIENRTSRVMRLEFQFVYERLLEKVFREHIQDFNGNKRFRGAVCELMDIWARQGSAVAAQLRDRYA